MKYRVYVDESKKRKDGQMPVLLIFEDSGKRFKVATGLFTKTKFKGREFPEVEPNARAKTIALARKLLRIDEHLIVTENEAWTDTQAFVKGVFGGEERAVMTLEKYAKQFAETRNAEGTRKIYRQTADKIVRYDNKATFGGVTQRWLEGFDGWLARTCSAIHMRNLKALMNWAFDEGLTQNMPFRKFKIKHERVKINNVPVERLRELRDCNVNRGNGIYRDLFMLSFYLAGINPVDLLNLTRENVRDGHVVYRRHKTGKLIEVPLTDEARRIMDVYKGEKHLLWVVEKEKSYLDFTTKWNRQIKTIAPVTPGRNKRGHTVMMKGEPIMPEATVYTARYTFASIGAELEIPRETIALCLGHSWADVTSHYIAYDQKRVDDAVRKIVDYVNADLKNEGCREV